MGQFQVFARILTPGLSTDPFLRLNSLASVDRHVRRKARDLINVKIENSMLS